VSVGSAGDWELAARARELDLIQALGRSAAAARAPGDLFSATISALQPGEQLDLLVVAHALEGRSELLLFLSRPVSDACIEAVRQRAIRLMQWPAEPPPVLQRTRLATYDDAQAPRETFEEDELVVLPLLRKGAPAAYLIVLPLARAEEDQLRLLYSATNQLSLHLDRIMAVREAEADRFRSILESMPQAVMLTDDRLRVVQANPAARVLLERIGRPEVDGARAPIELLGIEALVAQVRRGESAVARAEVVVDADTELDVTVTPLAVDGEGGTGLVLVLTDVTKSRRLQRQLAQSDKMSSLGQMLSGVAHELNNPLATILGYAQLLASTCRDERLAGKMGVLYDEARRCQRIVQNLLSFARQREPERTSISLNEVVRSVIGLMRYQMKVDDVKLEAELNSELPAILGDAHQLQQVIVNLLSNGRQAIREDAAAGTIRLRTACAGPNVRLEIADDGPGVPESIRRRIFDPFFTTKAEGKGTGLGLALVYGIVAAHGGTIELLSPSGGGATFAITLPIGRPASETKPEVRATDSSSTPTSRAGRILVVDDELPFAQVVAEALGRDGHQTAVAGDGRAALRKMKDEQFDLVISDLKMPGMGGERLHEEIERIRPGFTGRMLLTTGDTLSAEPEELSRRTGLEILHKPIDLELLRRRVRMKLGAGDEPA